MEGENQNYWPGFVDALSNMVMAMIFVVLTFVVVLFGTMQNNIRVVATRMTEMRTASADYQARLSALRRENATLQAQLERLQPRSPGQRSTSSLMQATVTVVSRGGEAQATAPTGRLPPLVSGTGNVISILYQSNQATLEAASRTTLDQTLAPWLDQPATVHAEIVSDIAGATAARGGGQHEGKLRTVGKCS